MARLDISSGLRGTKPAKYGGAFQGSLNNYATGSVSGQFDDNIAAQFSERIFEERLEAALEVCVDNTKGYINDIDLVDTGDLHDSIKSWEPRREGRYLVGSFGVPKMYNGHEMDYAVYQEIGFHHINDGWIQNEFMINGLQRSKPELRAIFGSGVMRTDTFTG